MRSKLCIISFIIFLWSCLRQVPENAFVIPFDDEAVSIDVRNIQSDIKFSKAFLNYLTLKFPAASSAIFTGDYDYNKLVNLSDTAYTFGVISNRNRLVLINTMPKNLLKEESDLYFKRSGFFTFLDSADKARQDSVFEERVKWEKAPKEIEKEYLKLYALVKDSTQGYLVIVKKELLESAPW
jgi:hypothetical protein